MLKHNSLLILSLVAHTTMGSLTDVLGIPSNPLILPFLDKADLKSLSEASKEINNLILPNFKETFRTKPFRLRAELCTDYLRKPAFQALVDRHIEKLKAKLYLKCLVESDKDYFTIGDHAAGRYAVITVIWSNKIWTDVSKVNAMVAKFHSVGKEVHLQFRVDDRDDVLTAYSERDQMQEEYSSIIFVGDMTELNLGYQSQITDVTPSQWSHEFERSLFVSHASRGSQTSQ
jgi:hypothetical protein